MIFPMMVQVDLGCLKDVRRRPGGLAAHLGDQLAGEALHHGGLGLAVFSGHLRGPGERRDANQYIAGMILLGVAPCTAMVFVWSQLSRGDPNYTLVQVSVNDLIMVFAFAPIAGMLLGVSEVIVPWDTLTLSVGSVCGDPAGGRGDHPGALLRRGEGALDRFNDRLKPASILGLLATVVLIFGLQAPRSWPAPA
jgi:ACR3 family arsenite transporter